MLGAFVYVVRCVVWGVGCVFVCDVRCAMWDVDVGCLDV